MDIEESEVQDLLDELYKFRDKVRESGNSKYLRLSNKDILFAVLKSVNEIKKENDKQEHEISKLKIQLKIIWILVPVSVGVANILLSI